MNEFKISCPHCQQHVAFPETHIGQVIACPACGLSVGLNVPGYAPQMKSHGVFYYVFWGVVSLIVTGFILFAVSVLFFGGASAWMQAKRYSEQAKTEKEMTELQARLSDQTNGATVETITAPPQTDDPAALEKKQKSDYIPLVELTGLTANNYNTYDGWKTGVTFRLKNNGDKTLNRVEVTIYFLDGNHQPVYDEKFYPVSVSNRSNDTPLRPGYAWQLDSGHFMQVSRAVPDEWQNGGPAFRQNVRAEITDIEFAQ
jgi:hypothetical protein